MPVRAKALRKHIWERQISSLVSSFGPARKVPRSIVEGARDMAREIMDSEDGRASMRQRKKIEMLFAHLNGS